MVEIGIEPPHGHAGLLRVPGRDIAGGQRERALRHHSPWLSRASELSRDTTNLRPIEQADDGDPGHDHRGHCRSPMDRGHARQDRSLHGPNVVDGDDRPAEQIGDGHIKGADIDQIESPTARREYFARLRDAIL
ncbi:MAG TPA: hypothetical protein VMU87_00520 [Stellaceae bacterium]|nr:hypothetical protein [Stellaceae bacterium]